MPTTTHTIIVGDARQMPEVGDESVHLVVTSPPYWQLKDYGARDQIGFHDAYRDYINNLNLVWEECRRVLHPGCRLCVNIGDQFARAAHYGRYKVIPIRTEIIRFCEWLGFDYMGAVIWQKVTTCNTSGGATIMGSFPYPRNGIIKIDYEFILIFKKPGKAPEPPSPQAKEAARLTTEEWNEYFYGHWNFPGERQTEHLAAFPLELPTRLIRMFTFPGETVLDPFLGSGTTSLAARRLGRNSVGYEINADLQEIIRARIKEGCGEERCEIRIQRRRGIAASHEARISEWRTAYGGSMQDISVRCDPRENSFGSRIALDTPKKANGSRVIRVAGPNRVEIDNGRILVLAGIKGMRRRNYKLEATGYLERILEGHKVHFEIVPGCHDGSPISAFLWLDNRLFVNGRMVRDGYAVADDRLDHPRMERLLAYEREARRRKRGLWGQ